MYLLKIEDYDKLIAQAFFDTPDIKEFVRVLDYVRSGHHSRNVLVVDAPADVVFPDATVEPESLKTFLSSHATKGAK